MVKIAPPQSKTAIAIYASYEEAQRVFHSWGLSISLLGEECDRRLWYAFHHAYPPERKEGRMLRLLETGNREEIRLLDDLRRIGCKVENEQARVEGCNGHLRGKTDGEVTGLPEAPRTRHVVEAKTHNEKNFNPVLSMGVARGKHTHHVQLQMYMHYRGIKHGLYLACNKNNENLSPERVAYDRDFCLAQEARAQRIIDAPRPPVRLFEKHPSKASWSCTYCPAVKQCHEGALPETNCRTCLHSTPIEGAAWHCAFYDDEIGREMTGADCPAHLYIPDLVPGEQIDADPEGNTVTYRMADGSTWVDGQDARP